MRSLKLCGLGGIMGLVLCLTSTAGGADPVAKPDLTIHKITIHPSNNKIVVVGVKNIGKLAVTKETKLAVRMYKMVNGKWKLHLVQHATVGTMKTFRWIHVTMPEAVTNCYIVARADALEQLPEMNEKNNSSGIRVR
jgi:hypothetical protein